MSLEDFAYQLVADRALLDSAHDGDGRLWGRVLDTPRFWTLRSEEDASVDRLSTQALQKAFVEDMLFVAVETARGAGTFYPIDQAYRFIEPGQHARVARAIDATIVLGLVREIDGFYRLNPAMWHKAQAFCGVFYGEDMQNPLPDTIDSVIAAGGAELLVDTLQDIEHELRP